jgi:predicted RNase H-like HicB family nuclease
MAKYEIIVYWSEVDNAYIAEVPELAGCMADGKNYVEAINKAEVIISEWIETARSRG